MRTLLSTSLATALLVLLLARGTPTRGQEKKPAPAALPSPAAIRPVLQKYCFECHNAKKPRGDLDLERLAADAVTALDALDVWNHVAERLRKKEMPPPKSPQPTAADAGRLLAFVADLGRTQIGCTQVAAEEVQRLYGSRPTTRRLNRTEYNHTVRDLFGIDLRLDEMLPSDGAGGEGFDNAGAALFTTDLHVEKYLETAELTLDVLLPGGTATPDKPVDPARLAAARKRLLAVLPGDQVAPREAARRTLADLLPRAFRRPVAAAEVERFLQLFDRARQRGGSYEAALKLALEAVLVSPHFLFLVEPVPAREGAYPLDPYPLASRLSYFLWASMPDEELLGLAAAGTLSDPAVLRGQVKRMVQDPRFRGLADSFTTQWLGLRGLGGSVRPDKKRFPTFDEALADYMRQETVLFAEAIFREDRSLLEFLDADSTFVNEPLAKHYGLPNVTGLEMRRVKLPADHRRGGLLGQASVLTVTSYPLRTSPVLRGRWLLDELLGARVPPPPPNVPELPVGKAAQGLSIRQQLEVHRASAECAGCHARMDPLGFALENFDAIGRWRDQDGGKPVDASGVLPSGEKFTDLAGFKEILKGRLRGDFVRNLSRKLLGFALARELNRADLCVVDDCVRRLEGDGYRAQALIEAVVLSRPFLYRYHHKGG